MTNKLEVSRLHVNDCSSIQVALNPADFMKFGDMIVDYIVITCYAEFEKKLNTIIGNRLDKSSAFSKRYLSTLSKNSKKQLHGHLNKNNLSSIIKDTFRKKKAFEGLVNSGEWDVYINFINFRDSIAHLNDDYEANKGVFKMCINSDYNNILGILEKILDIVNPL